MNTQRVLTVLLAAAAFALPAAASAQKLETGKWKVAVTTPNGDAVDVAFDVSEANGVMKGVLSAPILPSAIDVTNLKLEGRTLSFTFETDGTAITCKLERTATGSFDGPCSDSQSPPGRFVMTPPSAAAAAEPAAASAANAARLEPGKWTGTVNHPSMGNMTFDFDVPAAADGRTTMNIPSLPMSFDIQKLVLNGKKLTFGFVVEGQGDVRCEMDQQDDKSFKGVCVEGGGETSPVVMKPPVKG